MSANKTVKQTRKTVRNRSGSSARTSLHFRLGGQTFVSVGGRTNRQPAPLLPENQRGEAHPQASVTLPVLQPQIRITNGERVLVVYVTSGHTSPANVARGYSYIRGYSRKWLEKYLKAKRKEGVRRLDLIINCTGGATAFADGYGQALKHSGMRGRVLIDGACSSAATLIAYLPGWPVAITAGSHMLIHYASKSRFRKRKGVWERLATLTGDIGLSTTDDVMLALYRRRTGHPEERIRDWMAHQKLFRAAEAVAFGFADEMVLRDEWEGRKA